MYSTWLIHIDMSYLWTWFDKIKTAEAAKPASVYGNKQLNQKSCQSDDT